MNMPSKTVDDLLDDPMPEPIGGMGMDIGGGMDASPWHEALGVLTVTEDDGLELMTRTNPIMAKACAISYSICHTFRSTYVAGRNNQNMRLAVSKDGRGREEIVRSLGADSETVSRPESEIEKEGYKPAYEEE